MASLQAAVAFAEMHHPALAIAQYLHFNVARAGDIPFGVERTVTKSCRRFGPAARQCGRTLNTRLERLHASPSTSGGGF